MLFLCILAVLAVAILIDTKQGCIMSLVILSTLCNKITQCTRICNDLKNMLLRLLISPGSYFFSTSSYLLYFSWTYFPSAAFDPMSTAA